MVLHDHLLPHEWPHICLGGHGLFPKFSEIFSVSSEPRDSNNLNKFGLPLHGDARDFLFRGHRDGNQRIGHRSSTEP